VLLGEQRTPAGRWKLAVFGRPLACRAGRQRRAQRVAHGRPVERHDADAALDRLDQLGLARDTLVVFTSDHGEAFGEHGQFQHDDLYAGTLHVPLVLRWPGRLPAGLRIGSRVRLIDVMPTILELLGVPAPPSLQGQSLTPLLHDAFVSPAAEGAVSEYSDARLYESLRRGGLSYIVDGPEERLFDLVRDPAERQNVLATRPEEAAAMRAALERWRRNCRALVPLLGPRGGTIAPSDETARRLRALGYME